MAKFNFGNVKKQAQKDAEAKSSGGKVDRLKLSGGINKVLVLPPYKEGGLYKKVMVHQIWKNKKPVATGTCPRIKDGEDCKVCSFGWKLKEKYEDHKSEKIQNLWKLFMPTQDHYVNALDLSSKNLVPQPLKLPPVAFQLLLSEIDESESGEDICGLDEGRPLIIKGNGKEGNFRRYPVAKFSKNTANLVADSKVEEEEIMNALVNLDKLQGKVSEEKLDDVFRKLKAMVNNATNGGANNVGEDEDDDSDEDESTSKKKKKSKSSDDDDDSDEDDSDEDSESETDGDDDDDSDFEDDEDSDEDDKPAKKSKTKKSKVKDEDDEDSDDDSDEDADESDDDDGDEDDDSDSDDGDSDDDDSDDDEDDEPASKKSSKKKPLKKSKK